MRRGNKLENDDHQPVERIRTNCPAISSLKNYDLLFIFRKYHTLKRVWRPSYGYYTYEGNFDDLA